MFNVTPFHNNNHRGGGSAEQGGRGGGGWSGGGGGGIVGVLRTANRYEWGGACTTTACMMKDKSCDAGVQIPT